MGAQVILLCEDLQQDVFLRQILSHFGFTNREIRTNKCRYGSGEQFVREQFPIEVQQVRSRNTFRGTALVAVTDADTHSVKARENTLLNTLQPPRAENDPIVLCIPKRNIETWIHMLDGVPVNETDVYPKFPKNESHCKTGLKKGFHATYTLESWLHFKKELIRLNQVRK